MPRNSSGIYSLPVGAFVPGGLIKSADMNSNFSDIALALTGSLPVNGSAPMTGPLLLIDGTAANPGIAWNTNPATGFFRSGANQFSWVSAGAVQGIFGTGGLTIGGTLGVTGLTSLGSATVSGTLGVTGTTTLGNVTASGTLGVTGAASLSNLTVTGSLSSGTAGVSVALSSPLTATYGGSPIYSQASSSGGSANAQTYATGSSIPANYAYGAGQVLLFNPGFANTGATTLAANGQAARNILKQAGSALATLSGGEIQSGLWAAVIDDGTQLELLNPAIPAALTFATNTTLTRANNRGLIKITANVTLTLPAPYDGGRMTIMQTGGTAFTLATPGGSIYGPSAATAASSVAVAARTGVAVYKAVSDGTNWYVGALTRSGYQAPSIQTFGTAGSLTYTPTAGATLARIRMCGAGGGGGGSDNNGANGGTTSFGSWSANGGAGSLAATLSGYIAGGVGGTSGANGTGTLVIRQPGGAGGYGGTPSGNHGISGPGGQSVFGGGTPMLFTYNANIAGANAGGYGCGGGGMVEIGGGAGSAGAGEYVEFYATPATTSCIVGTGGVGGSGAVAAGGNGANGVIVIEEFFY